MGGQWSGKEEIKSLITSPAMINPATEGTKALLPGVAFLREAELLVESVSADGTGFWFAGAAVCGSFFIEKGVHAGSLEYTTFNFFIPRFFNSLRMTFANGQTEV